MALGVAILLLSGLVLWNEVLPARAVDRDALAQRLHDVIWIDYDPRGCHLTEEADPAEAIEQIEADLDQIRQAGFTGIVTFGAGTRLAEIPRLAKRRGLAVIMGVWDPKDRDELYQAALRRDFADAYCIGYCGLGWRYSMAELERAAARLKRRIGKPVTTSEEVSRYTGSSRLAGFGDWLFPDAHAALRCSEEGAPRVDVTSDIQRFRDSTRDLGHLAQRLDVPLIFNTVAYPFAGAEGASEPEQARFFAKMLDTLNDLAPDRGQTVRASIVPHSVFNAPWKDFYRSFRWNPYIGLFNWAGQPRPAVTEIMKHHSTDQNGKLRKRP